MTDVCFEKLRFFYKSGKSLSAQYLTEYVNLRSTFNYQTRSANKKDLHKFSCRTESFKHSFLFYVREWNKLDNIIRDAESIKQFKSMLRNFFSLNQKSLLSIHDPVGVKLLTRLRLQLSHLNEHKLYHNFKECERPMCDCGAETEAIGHFFLRWQFLANERQNLCDDVYQISASIENLNKESLIDVLLYGSDRFDHKQILLHKICYIQTTKRFERPTIDQCWFRSITAVVFFSYISAQALSAIQPFILLTLISSQILAFSKGCIGDLSYYVQHFTISVFVWGEC